MIIAALGRLDGLGLRLHPFYTKLCIRHASIRKVTGQVPLSLQLGSVEHGISMSFGPSDKELKTIEDQIGYTFKEKVLLRQAFLHPSFSTLFNNYRLSWIGDSALNLAVGQLVYEAFPQGSPEVLNNERTQLVRRDACADAARKLGWDKLFVVVPAQLKSSDNMAAELFEAVWGAVYEDCGAKDEVVRECFTKCYPGKLPGVGQTDGAQSSVASALTTIAGVSASQA